MKHAFIFGTTIFLSEQNTLTLNNGDTNAEFLRILSFNNHQSANKSLCINASVSTLDGSIVHVNANNIEGRMDVRAEVTANRVKIYQAGHEEPLLDVYQLDPHEFHGLSSHILNEINVQHPDKVLTIKGNFKVSGVHFLIENEKMFIDNNGYANGVVNAHHGIILSAVDHDF
ncbi:hypothetical protein [Mucilaginibacter sp. FT3.2]|uniref:hypothetical protein n=1 Tax=Mucilaginibacter sp. FT3.2 TaxID=2723090 RepID=UPI00160D7917|nr:hypothetical protein [Mucilaginibacter sp. FT3.2]MBB6230311.1 hypothetical protein [Mucilaginibacter sp. FT3.2]